MTISSIGPKQPQLTLNFEPELADDFPNLRAYLVHRLEHQKKPAKTIASDMDLAPSTLSRKLRPSEGDTQRFNVDDLEAYIRVTGDVSPIEYLASKYMHSDDHRIGRLVAKAERQREELDRTLAQIRNVA